MPLVRAAGDIPELCARSPSDASGGCPSTAAEFSGGHPVDTSPTRAREDTPVPRSSHVPSSGDEPGCAAACRAWGGYSVGEDGLYWSYGLVCHGEVGDAGGSAGSIPCA